MSLKQNLTFKIAFFGSPDFAVESLMALINGMHNVVCVVTAPDRPKGRGKKISMTPVKIKAQENSIPVLQPTNMKDATFFDELSEYKADINIVVAFRMMPEQIWNMPLYGSFNLHASLLPQYRGAAPINWAVINGEKETGVTTFFIKKEIDTGDILLQKSIHIDNKETTGELHDRMMIEGARLLVETVEYIKTDNYKAKSQKQYIKENVELKTAPKIFKEDCRICWDDSANSIYNFIRGMSPYPSAYTELISPEGQKIYVKVFLAEIDSIKHDKEIGDIYTDGKTYLGVFVQDAIIYMKEIQISGKKRMSISDFLIGFSINENWKV